jgi:hypothetical protein
MLGRAVGGIWGVEGHPTSFEAGTEVLRRAEAVLGRVEEVDGRAEVVVGKVRVSKGVPLCLKQAQGWWGQSRRWL